MSAVQAWVLDLIVPVLGRPQRAEPFVRSLVDSKARGVRVIVTASPWDRSTIEAWRQQEPLIHGDPTGVGLLVFTFPGLPGSFAQKCNHAYEATADPQRIGDPAPWLMLCGDDVAFHHGWWDAAVFHMERTDIDAVGTHTWGPLPDGGTPHPILRRSYVDEHGASWDGPGVLAHTGYRHNFVDVEIALAAQKRRRWCFPDASGQHGPPIVVEHLCHYQGKATHDATYQISDDTVAADRVLFTQRANRFHGPGWT